MKHHHRGKSSEDVLTKLEDEMTRFNEVACLAISPLPELKFCT